MDLKVSRLGIGLAQLGKKLTLANRLALGIKLTCDSVDVAVVGTLNEHHLLRKVAIVEEQLSYDSQIVEKLHAYFNRPGEYKQQL